MIGIGKVPKVPGASVKSHVCFLGATWDVLTLQQQIHLPSSGQGPSSFLSL